MFELKSQRASNLKKISSTVGSFSVYSCVCIHLHGGLYNYKKSDNLGMLLPITRCLDLNIHDFACVVCIFGLVFFPPWMSEFLSKRLETKSIAAFLCSLGECSLPIQYP